MTICSDSPTYRLIMDGQAIEFLPCHTTSYNLNDVINRYCAFCDRFIERPAPNPDSSTPR